MEKASSLLFAGTNFNRRRFAADFARFKPKVELVKDAKETDTPEVTEGKTKNKNKKRKRREKEKEPGEAVEGITVFRSSEAVPPGVVGRVVEEDLSNQRKQAEKEIERASILRKKFGIHIAGCNIPPALESFKELRSSWQAVNHIYCRTYQNLDLKSLHLFKGRPFQGENALFVHQQVLARH